MTNREKVAYLAGLGHGFMMATHLFEEAHSADEIKECGEQSLARFFQAMGFSKLSEAEEAEFTAIDKEISQIVGGLLRPPSERN